MMWTLLLALLAVQNPAPPLPDTLNKLTALSVTEVRSLLDSDSIIVSAELADQITKQADILRARVDLKGAERLYLVSAAVAEKTGDRLAVAKDNFGLGLVLAAQGEFSRALEQYKAQIPVITELGPPSDKARLYNSIALADKNLGDMEDCLRMFKESLYWSQSGSLEDQARTLFNLGNAYFRLGDHRQALAALQKSLAISEGQKIEIGVAYADNAIGDIYREEGNYDLALDYLQRGLTLKKRIGNYVDVIDSLLNIENVYLEQGDLDKAHDYLEQATALNKDDGRRPKTRILYQYGVFLMREGRRGEAIERFAESLQLSTQEGERLESANTLVKLSDAYLTNHDHADASASAARATDLASEVQALPTLAAAYDAYGSVYAVSGDAAKAESSFRKAIGAVEEMETHLSGDEEDHAMFEETQAQFYDHLIELLCAQKRYSDALEIAERKKARVLLAVLGGQRINIEQSMSQDEISSEHDLLARLSSLNVQLSHATQSGAAGSVQAQVLRSDLESTRLQLAEFNARLYARHPELETKRSQIQPLSLAETRDVLPNAQTTVFEYVVTEARTFLFVLNRNGAAPELRVFTLDIGAKALSDRVQKFQKQIAGRELAFRDNSTALYKLLVAPAAAQLQQQGTLVISPDGPLWQLSFQALSSAPERYLIEDRPVFFTPSLTVLRRMKTTSNTAREPRLLAMGDPSGHPIANEEREVRSLAAIYGASHSVVLTGADAREDTAKAKAPNFDVIHFATHGLFDDRQPMYSYLELVPSEDEGDMDGLLEAREIMNLNLSAEVVVLSACDTGRGRSGGGEGLIGMTWAFFIAGSPATVASQWKVDSQSTSDLMVAFHRGLKASLDGSNPRATKAAALQQAMISVMNKPEYRHPFYWAGFMIVGQGF